MLHLKYFACGAGIMLLTAKVKHTEVAVGG
jgi:hypothetical protein